MRASFKLLVVLFWLFEYVTYQTLKWAHCILINTSLCIEITHHRYQVNLCCIILDVVIWYSTSFIRSHPQFIRKLHLPRIPRPHWELIIRSYPNFHMIYYTIVEWRVVNLDAIKLVLLNICSRCCFKSTNYVTCPILH